MPTSPRPEEVGWWFRIGRRLFGRKNIPEIKSIPVFEDLWMRWWSAAQPEWRNTNSWPFSRDEAAVHDWGTLLLGGKDSLFLVVTSLGWWIHARDPAADSKVDDAISDVSWVIKQLVSSLSADTITRSPSSSPSTTTRQRPRSASLDPPVASSKRKGQHVASVKIGPPKKRTRR